MIRHAKASAGESSLPSATPRPAPRRRVALVLAAGAAFLLLLAPSASAANKYVQTGQISNASFNLILTNGVAVNGANGHIYVADSGLGEVFDYSSASDPSPDAWTGSSTPSGSFGSDGHVAVAVDETTGAVYVADRTHKVINKFDASGTLITSFGDTTPSHNGQLAGIATPAGSFAPATESFSSFAIAIDQGTHDLYVIDAGHQVIDVFDETGAYLPARQITATPANLYRKSGAYAAGIAVNATNHNVYVTDWAGPNLLFQFDSLGNYVKTWDGSNTPDENFSGTCTGCYLFSVATRDTNGNVVVGSMHHGVLDPFDANGTYLAPQTTSTGEISGLAFDQVTGALYASLYRSIKIFTQVVVPDASLDPVSNASATAITLNGKVDPAGGGGVTACQFEYIDNTTFLEDLFASQNSNPWATATSVPCTTTPPSSLPYSSPRTVTAALPGLRQGTGYRYRLTVVNGNGGNSTLGQSFSTVGAYRFASNIGSPGSGDGQLSEPQDVAVDYATGDVYVADTGNHRIVKFNSSGAFLRTWGWGVDNGAAASQTCVAGCQAGLAGAGSGQFETPRFVEVDNSDGPSAGDVYVADPGTQRVQKFDPSGNLLAAWGSSGQMSFSIPGFIGGITVNPSGDLFVQTPYNWNEIGQDSVFRRQIATGGNFGLGGGNENGIDINRAGYFYLAANGGVLVNPPTSSNNSPTKYDFISTEQLKSTGLVVDRDTNDLYVSHGNYINQFASSSGCPIKANVGAPSECLPSDFIGDGHLTSASGLAFQPSTQALFAADTGAGDVAVFLPMPVPKVATGSVTTSTSTSAVITGHVDPNGSGGVTDCYFEVGTGKGYDLGVLPCVESLPLAAPADVSASVGGLTPFVSIHYRLVATGANDAGVYAFGQDRSFTPVQGGVPLIASTSSVGVTESGAQLTATINPNLSLTVYRFEYGTDLSYGSRTPISESIGGDATDHDVSVAVGNLEPGRTYHFRVVAINFNGVSNGPDVTFTTPAAGKSGQPTGSAPTSNTPGGRPPSTGTSARCDRLDRRARRLAARAKALRGQAGRVASQKRSRALRRHASRLSKQAEHLAAKAKSCAANARKAR